MTKPVYLTYENKRITLPEVADLTGISPSWLSAIARKKGKEEASRYATLYSYKDRRPEPCMTCKKYHSCLDTLFITAREHKNNRNLEENAWPILFGGDCYENRS